MNKIQEEGIQQIISVKNLSSEKEQEAQVLEAMRQLEGQADSSLVLKNPEAKPSSEIFVTTNDYEVDMNLSKNSLADHEELNSLLSKASSLDSLEDKKKFLREMSIRDQAISSELALEPGTTFSSDQTYNRISMRIDHDVNWEDDEYAVQEWAIVNWYVEKNLIGPKKKKGFEKVYRGDPQIWTPLDHSIPQEQHERVETALRDFTNPVIYEKKYGTREKRRARLPEEKEQSEYVALPRRTEYVDEGVKLGY